MEGGNDSIHSVLCSILCFVTFRLMKLATIRVIAPHLLWKSWPVLYDIQTYCEIEI